MTAARTSRWIAGIVATVLGCTIGGLPAAANPTPPVSPGNERQWAAEQIVSGTASVRRAAQAALTGSDADLRAFVDGGYDAALQEDYETSARVLASTDGPALKQAALAALDGTPTNLRVFVDGGFETAWDADERLRVTRALEAGGPTTKQAAQAALAGTDEDRSRFLTSGLEAAQYADDRLLATTMLTGGANNSGPALDAAAQRALAGSAEDLHEFLTNGQDVARARDKEMASISALTEQAKQAGQATSREALAATEASARAVNAAQTAKRAAEIAASEAQAAGGAATGASAAAGRAEDAATAAAGAAQEAVSASNAAMRAAQVAADGARRASAAASLTARAATDAQSAAAAARTDADKASAARQAAQTARDAAAAAEQLAQVRAERDEALRQASNAASAAISASTNADAAASAADRASRQAGVSQAQAERTRKAAANAKQQAATAARAAQRGYDLAVAAKQASDEAFAFAELAAQHARNAAVAADEAAAQAGIAAQAAQKSAEHAAAASQSAQLAVSAAEQATELEDLARQADAARLAEATDQGVQAAREALAEEQAASTAGGELAAWDRNLAWDTAEEDRVPAATRTLLNEATAAGATSAVVLDRGRRAAVALMATGGEWTKTAAKDALAGSEVELRSWLTSGRVLAAAQDDRARVWHLVDTLPEGQEKVAAQAALDGTDAAVTTFLKTRAYPRKVVDDRLAISRILADSPGPAVNTAAQKALAGGGAAAHQFLRSGQHVARATDQRVEIARIMETAGPEVRAAAQVALEGPASYASYFIAVGQFEAAQRDAEQAAHVQAVRGLVQQAQQYAQQAVADAAEAQRVAAVAKGAAAEAAQYAGQAQQSAAQAAQYAGHAQQSAASAKTSADQAAASAETARGAAASAQTSAQKAGRSATIAATASQRAAYDAQEARVAKYAARDSALAAGFDAMDADQAARDASASYTAFLAREEPKSRSTTPGTGSNGQSTANDTHRYWNCLTSIDEAMGSPETCVEGFKAFGGALLDPAKCSSPSGRDSLGCQMVGQFKEFLGNNTEVMLDLAQLALGLCGMIPGVGEVCDGLDMAVSAYRGDWLGAGLSLLSAIPVLGNGAGAAKVGKLIDKIRGHVDTILNGLKKGCNSFTPGTRVLLADGRKQLIEEIRTGDQVLAGQPFLGRDTPRTVTPHSSTGEKALVDIRIDDDANPATPAVTITATRDHRFWQPQLKRWLPAASLAVGLALATTGTATAAPVVEEVVPYTATTTVHNLSVEAARTYYVLAGETPVLVHNEPPTSVCRVPGFTVRTPQTGGRIDVYPDTNGIVHPPTPEDLANLKVHGFSTFVTPTALRLVLRRGQIHETSLNLPEGLAWVQDGKPYGDRAKGHVTIYPTRPMSVEELNTLLNSLPWTAVDG